MTTVTDCCEMTSVETDVAAGTAEVHCRCGKRLSIRGFNGPAVDSAYLLRQVTAAWEVHVMAKWGNLDVADL
jgi:hypothetical protein